MEAAIWLVEAPNPAVISRCLLAAAAMSLAAEVSCTPEALILPISPESAVTMAPRPRSSTPDSSCTVELTVVVRSPAVTLAAAAAARSTRSMGLRTSRNDMASASNAPSTTIERTFRKLFHTGASTSSRVTDIHNDQSPVGIVVPTR